MAPLESSQLLPSVQEPQHALNYRQRCQAFMIRCTRHVVTMGWRPFLLVLLPLIVILRLVLTQWADTIIENNPVFYFHLDASMPGPLTGRLMLCLSRHNTSEPRYLVSDDTNSQQVFGLDVHAWQVGATVKMHVQNTVGYPMLNLSDIPEGEYYIQAVLNPYTLYNRSDGHALWLPAFHTFESEQGSLTAPGTLYSRPMHVHVASDRRIHLSLTHVTPELPPLQDTEYLKHIVFQSPSLSRFWGTPVYLQAWVLLPFGYHDHPDVHYPLFLYHSHYSRHFEFDFEPTLPVNASVDETYGHYLYRNWTGEGMKGQRGLLVQFQHANPYYDDSYAVNSANLGPYGDALTYEFIPHIEATFRGIGQAWARTLYGGSTGGWESFAVQVFYPNEYGGAWSFCPDALDFHHVQLVDIYNSPNAYYVEGDWTRKELGSKRNYLGAVLETMAEENHFELARGAQGRSGGQWDIWQAVYGPVGPLGYPAAIWNKVTGDINATVAAYWHEHYDLRVKLQREWSVIGPALQNQLHIYVGVMDSFYLNGGVYAMEKFLNSAVPAFNGTIEYGVADGKGFEHCWSGSYDETLSLAWNTLNQRTIPKMVRHMLQQAPADANLDFTRY